MISHYKYNMGERHAQWELKVSIYQHYSSYKFVLSDTDDDAYIATEYVTPSTANSIESAINDSLFNAERMENIDDVLSELQKNPYGNMFYSRLKMSPQLTDGVILLAQN